MKVGLRRAGKAGFALAAFIVLVLGVGAGAESTPTCFGRPATLVGTPRDDILIGTRRTDVIVGLGGDDTIHGSWARDFLCGFGGDDTIRGGAGGDRISGGAGHDVLGGGPGDDVLLGDLGDDSLFGRAGDDTLDGGLGTDTAYAGPDDDVCIGAEASHSCTVPTTTTTTTTLPPPPQDWIALTFDDGPVPGTYGILDILDEYGVKATFFISAWRLPANADIAREIVARGHSLQSHGFLHNRWPDMSSDAVRRDIEKANEYILAATGVKPTCIRPPFGATSARTTEVAESLGMQVVIWDENSADYAHQSSQVLLDSYPDWQPNSIVLAHDTNHYIWTPVLGEIIQGLLDRGLELVALCDD